MINKKYIHIMLSAVFLITFISYDVLAQSAGDQNEKKATHTMTSSDADNDGVNDHLDWCPNTPANAAVDGEGCPIDSDGDGVYDYRDKCPRSQCVSVDNDGCPRDTDRDGVPDFLDSCPDTPEGAEVNKKGCQKDGDGDGVYDGIDQCPDTPKGVLVDEVGCPVLTEEQARVELNVEFEFDKADIKSVYDEQLQSVAAFLSDYPDTVAIIEGHTDSRGTDEYNMKLSERRAESVKKMLVEKYGISPTRLFTYGYGESMPVVGNDTDEGRQQNRRTIAVLSKVIKKPVMKDK